MGVRVAGDVPRAAAAVVSALLMVALPAAGQSLGDAARKAQEQRKAVGPATRVLGAAGTARFEEVPLTVELVTGFAGARADVAGWLWTHYAVYERMHAEADRLGRQRDLVQIYDSEPAVKARIEFHGFTTEGFLRVLQTLSRTKSRVDGDVSGNWSELEAANSRFMAEHDELFRPLWSKWAVSNNWLPMASWTLPY